MPDNNHLRVLVVDDNRDTCLTLERLLSHLDCQVVTCMDPTKVTEVAGAFRPQLIMLDVAMPEMDGLTVAVGLRSAKLPPYLLAALTGYDTKDMRARCQAAGFEVFVSKPATLETLSALVQAARGPLSV